MSRNIFLVLLFFCPLWTLAQKDTISIKEIVVKTYRQNFAVGANSSTIDKSTLTNYGTQTLSDLLSEQSNITINTYGINGLSSISMRGAGSNHTAVVWNGINIQNHLNGGVNMALLPVSTMDNLSIQYGGCGALYGSGAIGGAILLNNSIDTTKGFKASYTASYGSFKNIFNNLSLNYAWQGWAFSSKLIYHTAKNNFPFNNTDLFGSPSVNQTNAKQNQMSFLQSAYFKINDIQTLTAHLWLEKNDNQIPTQMNNTTPNQATQKDDNYRFVALWQRKTPIFQNTIRTALLNDNLIYNNPLIKEYGNHKSLSAIIENENTIYITDNQCINLGINETNENGKSTNFSEVKNRNRAAMFASYKINYKDLTSALSFRDELVDNQFTPPTFSWGLEYTPLSFLQFKGTFSKNYRIPTFNELYWAIWGNPNLNAEKGWSSDFGFVVCPNKNFKLKLTAFNDEITDWILWIPQGTIWTPENIQKVHSYGLEQGLNLNFDSEKLKFGFDESYSYTISKNRETNYQLVYVPKHKISGSLYANYLNFSCRFVQNFESERSISDGDTKVLEPFGVGNLSVSYALPTKTIDYCISFKINNIWNLAYQIMPSYAMPLRNYLISFTINFNH